MTHEELTELMGIEPKPTLAHLRKGVLTDLELLKNTLYMMLTVTKSMIENAKQVLDAYERDAQDSLAEASAFQSMLDDKDEQIRELSDSLARLEKMESIHEPRD